MNAKRNVRSQAPSKHRIPGNSTSLGSGMAGRELPAPVLLKGLASITGIRCQALTEPWDKLVAQGGPRSSIKEEVVQSVA